MLPQIGVARRDQASILYGPVAYSSSLPVAAAARPFLFCVKHNLKRVAGRTDYLLVSLVLSRVAAAVVAVWIGDPLPVRVVLVTNQLEAL